MLSRVICAAVLAAGSSAPALAAATSTSTGGTERAAAVARWDGVEVTEGAELPGLGGPARESIERWRTFAEKRGYRIDLDESQRVLVISDAERFKKMSSSLAIVERVLEEADALTQPREAPVMLLRASNERDAQTARKAADGLGFGGLVFTHVETGSLRERRAVDARLAEAVVRAELAIHAPQLSEWMADGLASAIAEEVTDRAVVDGETETFRTVQLQVSKRAKKRERVRVDLLEVSGVTPGEAVAPRQDEALAIMAFLRKHHGDAVSTLVSELGNSVPAPGRAKYLDEEDAIRRACGLNALEQIEVGLRKGKGYRGR